MVEKAFKVSNDSLLYNIYFLAQEEKNKFHQLARAFFEKHELADDGVNTGYYMTENLCMQLSEEDRERFTPQLKKLVDKNGMCYFKKTSKMNKAWKADVVSKCDMNRLDGTWFWYFPYIGKGSYALWNDGETLYGYLSDENKDDIELPDWMIPIKMSEYYRAREERSERKNNE